MNKYLEKIALRRIVSEIAKGNVTRPLRQLVRDGFVKSEKAYAQGMARGNSNLAKETGAIVRKPKNTNERMLSSVGGGYVTVADKKAPLVIHNRKVANTDANHHEGFIRHELFEAKDVKDLPTRGVHKLSREEKQGLVSATSNIIGEGPAKRLLRRTGYRRPDVFADISHGVSGSHMSPRVLARESNMVRENPHLQGMKDFRHVSGEAEYVTHVTGKRYGEQKMTGKDLEKAKNATGMTEDQKKAYNYKGNLHQVEHRGAPSLYLTQGSKAQKFGQKVTGLRHEDILERIAFPEHLYPNMKK